MSEDTKGVPWGVFRWAVAGVCASLVLLSGYVIANDRARQVDKDMIRDKLESFDSVLINKLDTVIQQSGDIKCTLATYGKELELDRCRLDRLEEKIK